MKVFLAGTCGYIFQNPETINKYKPKYVLQSFWYLKKFTKKDDLMRYYMSEECETFLLDSGAFTFIHSNAKTDIKKYLDEYIDFINKYDIKHFFELDLYTVIGIDKTYEMTEYLERKTGKKSIPVFHKCLGMDRYRKMCNEYDYVAIGASGMTQECKWVNNPKILNKMVSIAHEYGCKIHGLGYTRLSNLNSTKIPFDTVDSSSCDSGSRFGVLYFIKHGKICKKSVKKEGSRLTTLRELSEHNFNVWIEFQKMKGGIYEK